MADLPIKLCFTSTDPTFSIASKVLKELEANNNTEDEESVTVTSSGIRGNKINRKNGFNTWYDFSRTAAVVIRLYMLNATNMIGYHDPVFARLGKQRNKAAMKPKPKEMNHKINMAEDKFEAQVLSAHFDGMFPHFMLENKFESLSIGQATELERKMIVLHWPSNTWYNIETNLSVTYKRQIMGAMIIKAIPTVDVRKNHLPDLLKNPNGHYTRLLSDLTKDFSKTPYYKEFLQGVQKQDGNKDEKKIKVEK